MSGRRLSLEPGVLKIGERPEEDVLLGSRCKECGRFFFPQRKRCASCAEPTTEVVELSREGILGSFSLMARKTKYALIATPYILAEVKVKEGILIYSVLKPPAAGEPRIGQRVALDTVKIKEDENGDSVVAYRFSVI